MTPGERLQKWINDLAIAWRGTLKDWLSEVLGFGIEIFADIYAKAASEQLKPMLDKLESAGPLPPEIKPLIDELRNPTGEFAAGLATQAGNAILGSTLSRLMDFATRPVAYTFSYLPGYFLPEVNTLMTMRRRYGKPTVKGGIKDSDFFEWMRYRGISPDWAETIYQLSEVIFPSDIVGPAWLRDKAKYEKYWDDVRALGISEDRLELIKEMLYRIPQVQDIIRYVVKEVYSDDEAYKTMLREEYPTEAEPDALKAGVRPDMLDKEWMAHWDLPGAGQGFEMLHREQITEEELNKLLKALDIMPFWRDKLETIAWNTPNRVELRLLARYGLVDKQFLVKALKFAGLHEEYRDILADLMLAQGIMTDISARYRKGWLDDASVKTELAGAGLSTAIQDRLYKWIVTNAGPDRLAEERELTATEIVNGVKKGLITYDEGISMLKDLNYSEYTAQFKIALAVTTTTAAADPETTVKIDTTRRLRRKKLISHDQELQALLNLGVAVSLATAYADNDDVRLAEAGTEETV